MSTRQERRRQERLAKKQPNKGLEYNQWAEGKGKENIYEMDVQMIQPWSVPIFKTTLPPEILQTMIEISDQVIAVIQCKCQQMPNMIEAVQREEWLIQMLTMWIVSQQPREYNPMHIHTQCTISSVMYLKVPKMLPSKKEHRPHDDGSILFVSNASRDVDLSVPNIVIHPTPGDFFIFGAQQQHAVYPYRCAEGQKETERRSISFNAIFQSKADFDRGKKLDTPVAVVPPGKSRPE